MIAKQRIVCYAYLQEIPLARVVVVDDHELIRVGLRRMLEQETDLELVGEASNAAELETLIDSTDVDVLILDINLPDRNGFDIMVELAKTRPKIAVVVLTMLPEYPYAKRARAAGAAEFVTKGTDSDVLVKAIRNAAARGSGSSN